MLYAVVSFLNFHYKLFIFQYVQNQEPVRTMSPISESKWKQFGTRKAVDNAFRDLSKKGTVHVLPQGIQKYVYKNIRDHYIIIV